MQERPQDVLEWSEPVPAAARLAHGQAEACLERSRQPHAQASMLQRKWELVLARQRVDLRHPGLRVARVDPRDAQPVRWTWGA